MSNGDCPTCQASRGECDCRLREEIADEIREELAAGPPWHTLGNLAAIQPMPGELVLLVYPGDSITDGDPYVRLATWGLNVRPGATHWMPVPNLPEVED